MGKGCKSKKQIKNKKIISQVQKGDRNFSPISFLRAFLLATSNFKFFFFSLRCKYSLLPVLQLCKSRALGILINGGD